MDRTDPIAFLATSRDGKGRYDIPSSVLLDRFAYVGPSRNATTTATSRTTAGVPIAVTFRALRPPVLSYFSIDCPACPEPECLPLAPKVIAADADLVLLRVPVHPSAKFSARFIDYFVYRAHPQRPKLDLLPTSAPDYFQDREIAVLSCGDGGGDYAVASLRPLRRFTFTLHLYRSRADGQPGTWTSKTVDVEEPLRDKVCPIPPSSKRHFYHLTTKVITLGGAKGTVGWVDLWRGILLCDVLEESPRLRDMPLPLPSEGNRCVFLNGCPYYSRNIIVNQRKDTIKYVEMEISTQEPVFASDSDRDSYQERMTLQGCPSYYLVPNTWWKATTWSMPIPVASWDGWQRRCSSVPSAKIGIPPDVAMRYKRLIGRRVNKEGLLSVECLWMAYPTMSVANDDDVYLLAKGTSMMMALAIDVRVRTLRGIAKLPERHLAFMRYFL